MQLGTPPKEFYVQIDTGSDVLWVSCTPCSGCPRSSGLQVRGVSWYQWFFCLLLVGFCVLNVSSFCWLKQIQLEFFDTSASSTSQLIRCSDQRCSMGAETSDSGCNDQNQCGYTFQYGDGSGTSGFYVEDSMSFDAVVGNTLTSNNSAPVVFG